MNEFLEAADGYVGLISTILWVCLVAFLVCAFREQIVGVLRALEARIEAGAEFKVAGLEVGKLVTETADLGDEVKIHGNPDNLKLLFKAQGKGWKKSTKALELPNGCVVQVTTERQSATGDWASAEAVVFVPDVKVIEESEDNYKITAK